MTRAPSMSFIVRVWQDDDSVSAMRGEVEHVNTGEKRLFLDYGALQSLIDGWRRELQLSR